tara:strand:- start:2216 stop:2911 length:696 start_codon:yes stop_codon:yes gene_type:complete
VERVLEPEIMDGNEQVKAYSEADFSLSDRDLCMRIEEFVASIDFKISKESLIVDLGCGPGNITERLSQVWPFAKVMGIDGSTEMLKVSIKRKEKLKKQGYLKFTSYIKEDLRSFSTGKVSLENPADVLVSNSVLHHIHNPNEFWQAIKKMGKKGTITFHRDLRRPKTFNEVIAIKEKYQPKSSSILTKDYLASLQAAFTKGEVESQLKRAGLCQLKVFEVDDRYLEIVGVL